MADAQKFLVTVTTTVFANTLSEAVQVIEQRVKTPPVAGPDPHYVQVQILNAQPYKEKR